MNFAQARDLVNRVTYAPGWEISTERRGTQTHIVAVTRRPNVTSPGTTVRLLGREIIDQSELRWMNERDLLARIRGLIANLESHEIDEWLRLDGKCVNEPHPALASTGG